MEAKRENCAKSFFRRGKRVERTVEDWISIRPIFPEYRNGKVSMDQCSLRLDIARNCTHYNLVDKLARLSSPISRGRIMKWSKGVSRWARLPNRNYITVAPLRDVAVKCVKNLIIFDLNTVHINLYKKKLCICILYNKYTCYLRNIL